jgi:hypothetical protein
LCRVLAARFQPRAAALLLRLVALDLATLPLEAPDFSSNRRKTQPASEAQSDESRRILVANNVGNPIKHSVATTYVKRGCSQMENLENRLVGLVATCFQPDELCKKRERPPELLTLCLEDKSRHAISLLFLGSAYLLHDDFVSYSGVIGPKLDPSFGVTP